MPHVACSSFDGDHQYPVYLWMVLAQNAFSMHMLYDMAAAGAASTRAARRGAHHHHPPAITITAVLMDRITVWLDTHSSSMCVHTYMHGNRSGIAHLVAQHLGLESNPGVTLTDECNCTHV